MKTPYAPIRANNPVCEPSRIPFFPETDFSVGFELKSTAVGLVGGMAAPAATLRPNDGGTLAVKLPNETAIAGGGEYAAPARSVSEDGRGGAAAVRLENRTHLDEARYRIKFRNYGNGLGEIGWSFIPALVPKKSGKGKSDYREENESRAARRAKSRLRHLILATGADHLLTLTYRDNVTDFEQSCSDQARFVRLVKAKQPSWVYIAVAEQQKRGAWHWHMAVKGRQDVELLRSLWRQVVGEGNIDVNPPKGKAQHRQLALVKYLGKYLAKGFSDRERQLNGRRFRASLRIEVPLQYLTEDSSGDATGQGAGGGNPRCQNREVLGVPRN